MAFRNTASKAKVEGLQKVKAQWLLARILYRLRNRDSVCIIITAIGGGNFHRVTLLYDGENIIFYLMRHVPQGSCRKGRAEVQHA